MNHQYIEENNIADSYALGKLPASERARFEEHYIDCEECLDRLESAEVFCRAVQHVMKGEAAPSIVALGAGLFGRMARIRPRWQTTLAVSLILLPVTLLVVIANQFVENRRLNRELTSVNTASSPRPARSPASAARESSIGEAGKTATPTVESSPTAAPSSPPASSRPDLTARVEPIEALRRLARPQVNVPIFALNSVRRAGSNLSASVNEIEVSSSLQWVIFSIELDEKPNHQIYRATIFTDDGRRLWDDNSLRPNRYDAFVLIFPTTFFQPRDYSIVLEGNTPDGRSVPAANYSFRITRKIP